MILSPYDRFDGNSPTSVAPVETWTACFTCHSQHKDQISSSARSAGNGSCMVAAPMGYLAVSRREAQG
jgi:hypothetical protein